MVLLKPRGRSGLEPVTSNLLSQRDYSKTHKKLFYNSWLRKNEQIYNKLVHWNLQLWKMYYDCDNSVFKWYLEIDTNLTRYKFKQYPINIEFQVSFTTHLKKYCIKVLVLKWFEA